jgi:hypothetical protein
MTPMYVMGATFFVDGGLTWHYKNSKRLIPFRAALFYNPFAVHPTTKHRRIV